MVRYSEELYRYVGKIELDAFSAKDSFSRYMVFNNALEILSSQVKDEVGRALVKDYLEKRIRETKQTNIGCASGEAGEAD